MPACAAYDMRKDELVHFEDDKMVDANCRVTWCKKLNMFHSEKTATNIDIYIYETCNKSQIQ